MDLFRLVLVRRVGDGLERVPREMGAVPQLPLWNSEQLGQEFQREDTD